MSDGDDKSRKVGMGVFCLLFSLCTTAFCLSLVAIGYCAFVSRNVTFADSVGNICSSGNLTADQQESCPTLLENHGVGFWGWTGTVPEAGVECFSYTQYVPGVGYVSPAFDTKFNSSYAFAITAAVFGGIAWATLAITSCCPMNAKRMKCLSIFFFLAFFFQALTFLIFRSSACQKGFFEPYFQAIPGATGDNVASVSCSLSKGSNCSVAATVLYFLCIPLLAKAEPPSPIPFPGEEEEQPRQQETVEQPTDEQDKVEQEATEQEA